MTETSKRVKLALEEARRLQEMYSRDFMAWIDVSMQNKSVEEILHAFEKKEASLKEANKASYEAYKIMMDEGYFKA